MPNLFYRKTLALSRMGIKTKISRPKVSRIKAARAMKFIWKPCDSYHDTFLKVL
jgi:hypothetical protein